MRQLHHAHILPLFGVDKDIMQPVSLITPWMPNGDLLQYRTQVGLQADIDRLVCLPVKLNDHGR